MLKNPTWETLSISSVHDILARSLFHGAMRWPPALRVQGRSTPLPFYRSLRLAELTFVTSELDLVRLFVLYDADYTFLLDGTSAAVLLANEVDEPEINEETAGEYLRLFCFAVRGDSGPFILFEKAVGEGDSREGGDPGTEPVSALARPLEFTGRDDEGRYLFHVRMAYDQVLFDARLSVHPKGDVVMLDDDPIRDQIPKGVLPAFPGLHPAHHYVAALQAGLLPTPSGTSVIRTLVEILLEHALSSQAEHRLLSLFNAHLSQQSSLDRFSHFLRTASPIVVLEGGFPFVEEVAADVVLGRPGVGPRLKRIASEPDSSDESRLKVRVPEDGEALILLSFHSYRGVADGERVAHELASRDASCLMGCDRIADLPDGLRRIVDLTLRLPPVNAEIFEALFFRVMGSPLPEEWRKEEPHWVKHFVPADLQQAGQLRLAPAEALEYIRGRVSDRLQTVDPVQGLSLSQLHGLGEARRFAQDLISDIHQAMAGRLDWREVDRGVLFVGPPGTGKTTLARAIAKECGVKFVQASAASWQTAGHLGDHIRAIRADFARARRFAPAILFLDEIDSMGSRELFTGHNAQYHTETVNALLEQMQGMDPTAPVMVLAATNYMDRVDPALRRAGRLDRVIQIPYPNVEALTAIYRHYLSVHGDRVDSELELSVPAGMSLGLTGADVELFVRGAARRARKGNRSIQVEDLVAEVTGSPRDPETSLRLSPDELERVAVHEAGHALASCLSSSGGSEVAFVSVVPRGDGTLGFVARMPHNRVLVTRREYMERLEIVLGGRAAEEICFGEEGITGGSGGSGTGSDLAVATRSALAMVAQFGLGPEGSLFWSQSPDNTQELQAARILREAYASVLKRLRKHEPALRELARELVQRQEMTGGQLREIMATAQS